jgi:hypothetical protein
VTSGLNIPFFDVFFSAEFWLLMNQRVYTVNEVVDSLSELTGHTIRVHGIIKIGREHQAIWHYPEYEQRSGKSCLWAFFHHATLGTKESDISKFHGQRVTAVGVIDASRKGHLSSFPGTLTIREIMCDLYLGKLAPQKAN